MPASARTRSHSSKLDRGPATVPYGYGVITSTRMRIDHRQRRTVGAVPWLPMCGISGVVAPEPGDLRPVAAAQIALLEHRGPDAHGAFTSNRATIAQNRLAIIDLVTGDPPITNEDRSIAVVLNGEIYNFEAIRERLLAQGHRFSSHGDTEVIAHLAEELSPVEVARTLD